MTSLPWLLGSFGTIAQDVIIFAQFRLYSTRTVDDGDHEAAIEEE